MPKAQTGVVHKGYNDHGHAIWGPEDAPEAESGEGANPRTDEQWLEGDDFQKNVAAKVVDAPKKHAPKKTEGAESK